MNPPSDNAQPPVEAEAQRLRPVQSTQAHHPTGERASSVPQRRNPRMYLRPELADRLVKLGVPDDSASLGNVVCELADMGLTLGNAYLPDLTDLVNVEVALHDRLAELAAINLHLLKLTVELGGAAEYRTLFYPFKQLAQRKERSQTP